MKTRNILSLLLLLTVSLAACQAAPTDPIDDNVTSGDTSSTESTADDTLPPPDYTNDDDGRGFTIVTTSQLQYIYADEMNGSAVNDAMYERDRMTEERLGVDIGYYVAGARVEDVYPVIQSTVMAGDAAYDLGVVHVNMNLNNYVSENLVLDWNVMPHVDFGNPWWNPNIIDSLSINGKAPFAAGSIFMDETVFLLFNKELATDLGLGSLYDYVYDGSWTWDKLAEISAEVMSDINGDSVYDETDRYGTAIYLSGSSWLLRNIPASCGEMIWEKSDDGYALAIDTEKMQTIIEKTTALFNGGGGYMYTDSSTQDVSAQVALFNQGSYLTYFVSVSNAAAAFNQLDFDYGILPLPKYDENQKEYYSLSWSPNLLVPATADPDFTGAVSEWLCYYGYTLVRPEFFDSLLSVRFAQDEESVEMLDIIFGNIVYDPAMNFKSTGFYSFANAMIMNNNTDFASYYQSKLSAENGYIDNLNQSFADFSN